MLELPDVKSQKNYPLAWLIGEFEGSGQLGGHFGLKDTAFEIRASFTENADHLEYSFEVTETKSKTVLLTESGIFEQIERPATLQDDTMFAVKATITTKCNLDSINKSDSETYRVEALGLIGKGKLELVSDKIELLSPEAKIGDCLVNDLWREKRLFGWVNERVLFATDLAFIGTELESFCAGGMWKKKTS